MVCSFQPLFREELALVVLAEMEVQFVDQRLVEDGELQEILGARHGYAALPAGNHGCAVEAQLAHDVQLAVAHEPAEFPQAVENLFPALCHLEFSISIVRDPGRGTKLPIPASRGERQKKIAQARRSCGYIVSRMVNRKVNCIKSLCQFPS